SPRMKLSTDKSTYPGRKQVYRYHESGKAVRDVLAGADESLDGEPLLVQVMRNGKRTAAGRATMEDARSRARESLERLPDYLHALEESEPYPVEISERLRKQADELAARLLPT
ncbi:MAG TPA: nicotinate phosphoribosyltransferase, partial [Rhodothermales bacterium]